MIEQFSDKIAHIFWDMRIISEQEITTFRYCFKIVFMLFIFLLCTLPVAFLINHELSALLFLFSFLLLRSVAGGFHTTTPERCLLLSIISFFLFLFINFLYQSNLITSIIFLLATIIIVAKAPMEAPNYPLSENKRKRHKIQCCILLIFLTVLYFSSIIFKISFISASIFTTILFTCVAVLITK